VVVSHHRRPAFSKQPPPVPLCIPPLLLVFHVFPFPVAVLLAPERVLQTVPGAPATPPRDGQGFDGGAGDMGAEATGDGGRSDDGRGGGGQGARVGQALVAGAAGGAAEGGRTREQRR